MLPIDPTIYYVIVVSDWQPHDASPMQGFAPSLCESAWVYEGAAVSAATVQDYTPDGRDTFVARRMAGMSTVHVYPQSPRAVRSMPAPPFAPFTLYFIPDGAKLKDYAVWAESCAITPTFVARSGGDLAPKDLTLDNLKRVFLEKLDHMPAEIDPASVAHMRDAINAWAPLPERKVGFQVKGHGTVRPNASALMAAGFSEVISGPFDDHQPNWKPYVEQIVQTANAILDERDAVSEREMQRIYRTPPDVNLYAPAIYPNFFDLKLKAGLAPDEKRRFLITREMLRTQSGYSFTVTSEAKQRALIPPRGRGKEEPRPHRIFFERAKEINLGTAVMCALAASEFSTVLRMPNEINRTSGSVRSFAEHYRSRAPTSRKRVLAFRQVQDRLNSAFPEAFRDVLRRSESGVRIVSDAHVEWLDLDGMPLMIRKTCSRLPVTPGNLFVSEAGAQPLVHLSPDDLRKVLVVSALKAGDPIAGIFDDAFLAFETRWKGKLDITTVTVSSRAELIRAINSFEGYMMVFDGHGGHEPEKPAVLYLQDEAVDVWSLLPDLTRVPPIIILSACDTHAADRNHATTANGFISLGARAVLASVFPLDARAAAIFTARFLYRVADFLRPAIGMFGQALRWSDVVSGMLRMQLLTDFLRALRRQGLINGDQYRQVHVNGNLAINSDHNDPFGEVLTELEALGLENSTLKRELEVIIANSEVISYLHIGRPETILIDEPVRVAAQIEEMDKWRNAPAPPLVLEGKPP